MHVERSHATQCVSRRVGGVQLLLTCIPSTLCARCSFAGEGAFALRRTGERRRRDDHHEDSDVARARCGTALIVGMLIRKIVRAIGHRRAQEAHDHAGKFQDRATGFLRIL